MIPAKVWTHPNIMVSSLCVCAATIPIHLCSQDSIEHELTKWAEMSTKNFYTNDAIYLRFKLNYYTEIVHLNKVQFLLWASDLDERERTYAHKDRHTRTRRELLRLLEQ